MNIHMIGLEEKSGLDQRPGRAEAEAALATLRAWAQRASDAEIAGLAPGAGALVGETYPVLSRAYPADFAVTDAYKDSMPDLQNGPASLIVGAKQIIQHVGISNFRLPIRYRTRDNGPLTLETSVTGTVSLEAEKKGINMSRIMRSFYDHKNGVVTGEWMGKVLKAYLRKVETKDARLKVLEDPSARELRHRTGRRCVAAPDRGDNGGDDRRDEESDARSPGAVRRSEGRRPGAARDR